MTTYQDPPLQSRRAVRQGERPEGQQPSSPFAPPQVPRTAAGAGEPLNYVTQNRPPLPGYGGSAAAEQEASQAEGAAPHGRRVAEPATPDAGATPANDPHQAFRPRDYSPEARSAPPAWTPEHDRDSGVVEYHTQARAQVPPPAPQPAATASLAASLLGAPEEQTLTRRELRALRDEHGITRNVTGPVAPLATPQSGLVPPPAPTPSSQLDSAMAEFDALAGRSTEESARRAGRRAAPQPYVSENVAVPQQAPQPEPYVSESVAVPAVPTSFAPPALVEPSRVEPAPRPAAAEPTPMAPTQFAPAPVTPTPVAPVPEAPAPAAAQVPAAPTAAPVAPQPVTPTPGERPVGHWTNQSEIDDRIQVSQSTISRSVGSAAITTSALVLPSIPGQDMATGEVMLTDSVSLPANLAATGAHHSIDESDLDHLLDPGDHQAVNTDSVPIRAIRAVSSHTNSRNQVLATAKPHRGNRALTALIVSASGMVVVVTTLLVVALVNGGI